MTKIEPVVFPILGTATKLAVTVLNFATNAKSCNTYYVLSTEDDKKVTDGNYQLTEAQFTAWGADNSYVDNAVAAFLGVVIIPQFTDDVEVSDGGIPQTVTIGSFF